jgi:hypothetical protein
MTTFGKMHQKLINELTALLKKSSMLNTESFDLNCLNLFTHTTIFWAKDDKGLERFFETGITLTKSGFFENIKTKDELYVPQLPTKENAYGGIVSYLISSDSIWCKPIDCDLCYPEKNYFEEQPLIETDPTSTVPAQQYPMRYSTKRNPESQKKYDSENTNRILKLHDCVAYGHIVRGRNHFQYYIDTQRYFTNAQKEVQTWLDEEGRKWRNAEQTLPLPYVKIIFSPEHNTNVGFSQ